MNDRIANLPWYDLPELQPRTDAFWEAVARRLGPTAPAGLLREGQHGDQLRSDRLLLSQTCGYDVVNGFRSVVRVVATPSYRIEGVTSGSYRSYVVVRKDSRSRLLEDLRGTRLVINSLCSHSGTNALRALIAPIARSGHFFASVTATGSHVASLERIAAGDADTAAIDCVTYGLLKRVRPSLLERTRVVARTAEAPAPPFVTRGNASDEEVSELRAALADAIDDDIRDALLLDGVEAAEVDRYESIADMERAARALGYTELERVLATR